MKRNAVHRQTLSTQLHVLTSLRLGGKEKPVQAMGNVLLFGEKCSSKTTVTNSMTTHWNTTRSLPTTTPHFYSVPIECNERDAPYVLDVLLYNESDLQLEEHYTDTHGYTEIHLAAFAMLGKRFCPRIRKVQKQRIYRINTHYDNGAIGPLVSRGDRQIKMDPIVETWDRMRQFYATLQRGHTTASVALKRLNSMSRKNRFYFANRELGPIFKTEFILDYMSQPPLRRQIRRGLLNGDHLHSLARDVAFTKRGRITKRDFYELMKHAAV